MEYNLRLTIEGSNIAAENLEIKIFQEGFAGTAVIREGAGEILKLDWGKKSGELLPLIYGSSAQIGFIAENDYEFLDLFATNARDIYIEIWVTTTLLEVNTTSLIFAGFIEPEKWSEPLISPGYEVSLSAFDGLGLLKDEDFLDDDKLPYEGTITPLAILQLILSKAGLSLPLNTAVNYRPALAVTTADALTQVTKDLVTYIGFNCYEVLEALFTNTRIFQRAGEWWIISNALFINETVTCYHYLANGTASGTTVFNTLITNTIQYEDEATLEIVPALKQITIKADYGYNANIIVNSNFENLENGNFEGWEHVGTVFQPEQRTLDTDGNKYIWLPGKEWIPYWAAPRSKGIRTKAIAVKATANIPVISLSAALMGTSGESAALFFGIKLIATDSTEYSAYAELFTDRNTIVYKWIESTDVIPIPVAPKVTHTNILLGPDLYFVDHELTETYPADEVTQHFKNIAISLKEGIPESGNLYIYLFLAQSESVNIDGSCWREISMKFTDENEEDLATGNELIIINSLRNNFEPEDLEIINGTVPLIENNLIVYSGSFILPDGTGAANWKLDTNDSAYTYGELMGRLLADQLRFPKQSIKARLMDVPPSLAMVFTDPDNPGHLFLEAGISFDFVMNTIEGNFIEIIEAIPTGFTTAEKIDFKSKSEGGGKSKGTTYGTDEKVGMITPSFEIVNQPGYLSTDYFEQEIDTVSGRAIIRTRQQLPDGLISGGIVTWITGLTFSVSPSVYVLNGNYYTSDGGTFTLSAADATNDRIDVFAVNTDSETVVIEGTPAASPVKPSINPATQLELTFVIIPAAAAAPDVDTEIIYNENTEWTGTYSGPIVDFDDTTDPYTGTKATNISTIGTGDFIKWTAAAAKTVADYEVLTLFINLKVTALSSHGLYVKFMLAGVAVSNEIKLPFNTTPDVWQNCALAFSAFTFTGATFDEVVIRWEKTGTQTDFIGLLIDLVQLQKGITQPPQQTDTYATAVDFNTGTRVLTITRNNALPALTETIPTGQIQSDWTQATTTADDYIKNKPTIPNAYTLPTASDTVLGGIKIGTGLSIAGAGILSADAPDLSGYLPLAGGTMTGGITNSTSINPLTTLAESWIGPSSIAGIYFKGGNVGIGTMNPQQKLEVTGEIKSSYFPDPAIFFWQTWTTLDGSFNGDSKWGIQTRSYGNTDAYPLTWTSKGNVGIGTTNPTAVLHLKASTASANTGALKFTAGVLATTPESGLIEFDGTNWYLTI